MPLAVAYHEIQEEEKPIETIETMRSDGEVQSKYLLGDYKSKFGTVSLDSGVKGRLILTVDRITTTSIVSTFTKNSSSQLLRRLERAQSAN